MRVLRNKKTKRLYAVKTFRLPTLTAYDKENAVDLEQELVWNQVSWLRQMNHPNLPVMCWVYQTKRSFFREHVFYNPRREFVYQRRIYHEQKE